MKKKNGLLILLFSLMTFFSYSQEFLDVEKHKEYELFANKKNYDVQERIDEIKGLEGKLVTVFHVSGKKNKIKLSYTGTVKMADYPKITDNSKASIITVYVKDDKGMNRIYYPMTNNKKYRIYLTEKIK